MDDMYICDKVGMTEEEIQKFAELSVKGASSVSQKKSP
jgi:hypothetical protein